MNDFLRRLLCLPEQASSVARAIDALHFLVIITTMIGATAVGLIAVWFAVRYRRTPERQATAAIIASPLLEGSVITALVALFVGVWYAGYRQYLQLQIPPEGALEITVSAKQWMWSFAYPGGQRSLSLLVVPTGQPVRLQLVSRDVIHGFYVPAFRIKHDVVPGSIQQAWFTADLAGTFPILCTQYCGTSHASMRGAVVALPPADYALWLQGSLNGVRSAMEDESLERRVQSDAPGPPPLDYLIRDANAAERGRQAAARHGCLSCHSEDGQRHIGPTWRGLYLSLVPLSDGRTVLADGTYLTRSMMDPLADVVAGFVPVMPSFQGLLDPEDAACIVAYIESLSGPAAQPPSINPALPKQPYRVGPP